MRGKTNKGRAFSNPNLLDNPWFTINQRDNIIIPIGAPYYDMSAVLQGNTTRVYQIDTIDSSGSCIFKIDGINYYTPKHYTVSGYIYSTPNFGFDRWGQWNCECIKSDTGIKMRVIEDQTIGSFSQSIDIAADKLINKVCTLSIKFSDGNIVHSTDILVKGKNVCIIRDQDAVNGINAFIVYDSSIDMWKMVNYVSSREYTNEICAVKLELGTISTLANDIAPNYAEELAKCQRYLRPIWDRFRITRYDANYVYAYIKPSVEMRKMPTLIITDSTKTNTWYGCYVCNNSVLQDGFSFVLGNAVYCDDGKGFEIAGVKTSHGLTDGFISICGDENGVPAAFLSSEL